MQLQTSNSVITEAKLVEDFKSIGILEGDTVAVTLSLKSVGYIEGGADTFIDALLQAVGPHGTIMMNAYTHTFPASEIPSNYIFDPASTAPNTGVAPKILLKRAGAIRSTHPVCSVVAIGENAKYLTQTHNEKARPYLPYTLLAQLNGKYLSIGTGNNLVAIRHEAQYHAGIPRFLRHGVQYRNSRGEIGLFVFEHPPCEKKLPSLVPELDRRGIIRHGKIGQANANLTFAYDFISHESELLRGNPALNQCGDILCLQCREIERRMNLWGDISEPRFFQRSRLMRKVLQFRNYLLILKRYNRIVVQDRSSGIYFCFDSAFQVLAKKLAKILT
jgi:aminoglycoside 3-N-acetyltransferase